MKTKLRSTLSTYFLLSLTTLHAAVPLKWTVETSRVQPAVFDVVRGETIELEAAFTSYGKPVATTNETAFLCWQTNGMESAWWVTNATTALRGDAAPGVVPNRARAVFTPSMDPGAATVTGFIGISSSANPISSPNLSSLSSLSYRAAFTLRFRKGPGAVPNALPMPPKTIDWATVANANAEAAPFAVDRQVTNVAEHAVAEYDATNITARIAAKQDKIADYATTNAVREIAASASVTNAGAVADAAMKYRPTTNLSYHIETPWTFTTYNPLDPEIANRLSIIYNDDPDEEDGIGWYVCLDGDWCISYAKGTLQSTELEWSVDEWGFYEIAYAGSITFRRTYVNDRIALKNESDTLYAPTSTAVTVASHTTQLSTLSQSVDSKADATTVATLSQSVSAASAKADQANLYSSGIYQYMIGNTNAWFAGTNYVTSADATNRTHFVWETGMDAASVPCSFALWEIRNGQRQQVWDQRDWTAWYWSFKAAQMRTEIAATNAAIRAEIASTNNHAWARYYAATGRKNPDRSTTYVDTPKICLSPGMNWETVAEVSGCGYWTIVGNGAVIGGSGTNAVLQIKDFEGNEVMTVTKGSHELVWLDSNDFTGQMTDVNGWVCFDMMSDAQPIGYYSTTLESDDFIVETSQYCPAQYRWENLGEGKWRVHFLLKPGIASDACFAKFQSETQGQTTIRYNAGLVISGGLIYNGVKIVPVIPNNASAGTTITWKVAQ